MLPSTDIHEGISLHKMKWSRLPLPQMASTYSSTWTQRLRKNCQYGAWLWLRITEIRTWQEALCENLDLHLAEHWEQDIANAQL